MRYLPRYVSRALFEAVFGPIRRDDGNVSGSRVHADPARDYERAGLGGTFGRSGRTPYYAPQGRKDRAG